MKAEITRAGIEFEIHAGGRALMRAEHVLVANARVKDGVVRGRVVSVWGATILDPDHGTEELRNHGVPGNFRMEPGAPADLATEFSAEQLYLSPDGAFHILRRGRS